MSVSSRFSPSTVPLPSAAAISRSVTSSRSIECSEPCMSPKTATRAPIGSTIFCKKALSGTAKVTARGRLSVDVAAFCATTRKSTKFAAAKMLRSNPFSPPNSAFCSTARRSKRAHAGGRRRCRGHGRAGGEAQGREEKEKEKKIN